MNTQAAPALQVRDINLSLRGARKVAMSQAARARFQAQAQRQANMTGDIVRFRAPDGTVLVEATPALAAVVVEAKAAPACQTCAVFGQVCCKRHRYRADCKLICGTHPAFGAAPRPGSLPRALNLLARALGAAAGITEVAPPTDENLPGEGL